MSEKAPHLLLCAALLAAPSALSWIFHKSAVAAMDYMGMTPSAAATAPKGHSGRMALVETAAVAPSTSTLDMPAELPRASSGGAEHQEGVPWLKMSYSVLPLVWAGEQGPVAEKPLLVRRTSTVYYGV